MKIQDVLSKAIGLYDSGNEEGLESLFYEYMEFLKIDIDSEEFDYLTDGGGVLSSEEMISILRDLSEKA